MMATEEVIHPPSDSFWEVECYKRTVKRQDDGYKLCSELMQLIQERGHIEKEYAKSLKGWSKKWTDLIDKGKTGLFKTDRLHLLLKYIMKDMILTGIALTTRQIANGQYKLNLANQILVKVTKTDLSGD